MEDYVHFKTVSFLVCSLDHIGSIDATVFITSIA